MRIRMRTDLVPATMKTKVVRPNNCDKNEDKDENEEEEDDDGDH